MLRALRSRYAGLITSVSHLALLLVALQVGSRPVTMVCLLLIATISFFAWMSNYRRMRLIADTPTSRIGSAAQGYVELYGRASAVDGLLVSPLNGIRCVWYRYWVYRRVDGNKWREVDRGVSRETFEIIDDSGRCIIDPDDAEIVGAERTVRHPDRQYRHVEELLYGHAVYALGEFATLGGAAATLDAKADVAQLLAEWKRDKAGLHRRFDLNGDGEIDLREWALARRQAQREVAQLHREIRTRPGVHVMRAPRDERIFILSNHSPQRLRRKYRFWSAVHLLVLLAALGAVVWLF